MRLRIATIDNLSAAAWRQVKPDFPTDFFAGPPSATLAQMSAGAADAALVPVAGLKRLAGIARPLGNYGIACEGAVSSVALFSRAPLDEVMRAHLPVHVTEKSETSRRLLHVLCQTRYGDGPALTSDLGSAVARLLIGDDSMDWTREEQQWPVRIDLGSWWFHETSLPFVFARWVVREGIDDAARAHLLDWLEESAGYAASAPGMERMAHQAISEGRIQGDFVSTRDYYRAIRPLLTPRDLQGLRHFLALQLESAPWALSA
jgi:predicted solute-binding protein